MNNLQQGLALDELAQHLYPFLPGKPHPHAPQDLSFPGVATELGLSGYWQGGSKQPAIRKLLEGVLNSGTGRFSALILKIVERSITYRKRSDPVSRGDIERLNQLLVRLNYKIPDLHSTDFLNQLPRKGSPEMATVSAVTPQALAALQDRLMKLSALEPKERGFAFERFLNDLFVVYGLDPRGSFRLVGEQIDGSF